MYLSASRLTLTLPEAHPVPPLASLTDLNEHIVSMHPSSLPNRDGIESVYANKLETLKLLLLPVLESIVLGNVYMYDLFMSLRLWTGDGFDG